MMEILTKMTGDRETVLQAAGVLTSLTTARLGDMKTAQAA